MTDAEKLPTRLTKSYVRYVLGFGVAVGIGLAPFLGKVPGLDVLLRLYPQELQASLIPLSAFLMGLIALAIQFHADEAINRPALRKRFRAGFWSLLAGLAALLVLYTLLVVRVDVLAQERVVPVVIGFGASCCPGKGDAQCIKEVSTDPAAIESCWGSGPVKLSRILLSLSYLMMTGGLGALVGLRLLQEVARLRERGRRRRTQSRRRKSPSLEVPVDVQEEVDPP